MAQKRMFDRAIIDLDKFMDMPLSTKGLYFLLGMEADDEGFVSYKKVLRIHGGNEDDVKILIAKEFLISFPSGVVVITDWNSNNWLDSRRMKPTEYTTEKKMLGLTENKKYVLSNGLALAKPEERRREESILSANAESSAIEIVPDLEVEKAPRRAKKVTPEILAVFELFDNPAKAVWKLREVERTAAQVLYDTYGLETLKRRIQRAKEAKEVDSFASNVDTPLNLLNNMPKLDRYFTT